MSFEVHMHVYLKSIPTIGVTVGLSSQYMQVIANG